MAGSLAVLHLASIYIYNEELVVVSGPSCRDSGDAHLLPTRT